MFLDVLAWIFLILLPLVILYGIGWSYDKNSSIVIALLRGILTFIIGSIFVGLAVGILLLFSWAISRLGTF